MKLLIRNWGFWCIIYALFATFTIVIMAIVWSKQECPASVHEVEHKIEVLNLKQKRYEELISNDSVIIWSSDRKYRDSIRAMRLSDYLQR